MYSKPNEMIALHDEQSFLLRLWLQSSKNVKLGHNILVSLQIVYPSRN